jgi:hypothetical protein
VLALVYPLTYQRGFTESGRCGHEGQPAMEPCIQELNKMGSAYQLRA